MMWGWWERRERRLGDGRQKMKAKRRKRAGFGRI
jgi:hypothetical protein